MADGVVSNGQTVAHRSRYCIKWNRKLGTASSFMRFPPYFYFRFGQQWLSVAFFAHNVRISLRSRQQTSAYGTTADDQNTKFTFGSTGSVYWTSQVSGSTLLPSHSRGFRNNTLRGQTAVFAVSIKPEVVVC